MVCIIDDREDVWNFSANLIQVKPYLFFHGTADINAPPGLDTKDNKIGTPKRKVIVHKIPKNVVNADKGKICEQELHSIVMEYDEGKDTKTDKTERGQTEALKEDTETHKEDAETPKENTEKESSNDVLSNKGDVTVQTKQTHECKEQTADVAIENETKHITNHCNEVDKPNGKHNVENGNKYNDDKDAIKEDNSCLESTKEKPPEKDRLIMDGCIEEVDVVNLNDDLDLSGDEKASTDTPPTLEQGEYDEVIEWEDPDDYLLYLEDILTRVHTAYFQFYKQTNESVEPNSKIELPTVKNVVPYVKRKTLKGVNIMFSGVIPTNAEMEKCRAYTTALALGATIHNTFQPGKTNKDESRTTHVVAARPGTIKVKQAQKHRDVKVVSTDWLWTCNERWDHVDERLFPLHKDIVAIRDKMPRKKGHKRKICQQQQHIYDMETGKKNQKDMKIAKLDDQIENNEEDTTPYTTAENSGDDETSGEDSGEEEIDDAQMNSIIQRRFSETYNPIATFSSEDLSNMDKEVDEIFCESDDESDNSSVLSEKELRNKVLGIRLPDDDSSDNDSLTGDYPLGWGKNRKPLKSPLDENGEEKAMDWGDHHPDKAREEILQRQDSSTDMSDAESIWSVDEEMAAALEKELLA